MAYHAKLVALTVLLGSVCLADEDFDIPVAAWELPADASRPENIVEPVLVQKGRESNADLGVENASPVQGQQAPFIVPPKLAAPVSASAVAPAAGADGRVPSRKPTTWKDDTGAYNLQTAATVNGSPILKGEVLDRYAAYLPEMRKHLQLMGRPQSEYNAHRDVIVERELAAHVQNWLIAAAMESSLSAPQFEQMRTQLAVEFATEEVPKLWSQFEVDTRDALEIVLRNLGTRLAIVEKNFSIAALVREFLSGELNRDDIISEDDMRAYYEAHLPDYAFSANIDWQQIQITFFDDYSKTVALERMGQAREELGKPVSIEDISKKYSDGLHAKDGGTWKGMVAGTLTDQKLEQLLFEMHPGRWSEIYEGPTELQLVRVVKRSAAGMMPYDGVKKDIRGKLNAARVQKLVQQMIADAKIESDFDLSSLKMKTE
jgi:hypothetical protein